MRFGSLQCQSSVAQHDELIRFRAVGDVQRAAVADSFWHSLPTTVEPIVSTMGRRRLLRTRKTDRRTDVIEGR